MRKLLSSASLLALLCSSALFAEAGRIVGELADAEERFFSDALALSA